MKKTAFAFSVLLLFASSVISEAAVQHDLHIVLDPRIHQLSGTDRITITNPATKVIEGYLSPSADITTVKVNGKPYEYQFQSGVFSLEALPETVAMPLEVTIEYKVIFNDPAPQTPVNTDNPGFGVTGTISPRGSFLLAGAGWYPDIRDSESAFKLSVDAPEGMVAVTAGRSLGRNTAGKRTVSRWWVQQAVEGLSLSVGQYKVTEKELGDVQIATYFLEATQHLSPGYLAATERYIRLYEDLFGPYPFEKFAVVENFFPTGYGFPSYTLMGGRVLQLPFIIHTSLGHEIAHCWWGNGVLVDYDHGNWSEGLTTYVADYLYKEKKSRRDARQYRRQALRSYATLVSPADDFPAARFSSRHSPATKAVGYDKVAMVFHMLRIRLGDEHFWGALKDLYGGHLFQKASWVDFKHAFERRAGVSLDPFFKQWVMQKGAPRLSFDAVKVHQLDAGGWKVSGLVKQTSPSFRLSADIMLDTGDGKILKAVVVDGPTTAFEIDSAKRPKRVVFDPENNLFRRLDPVELPPTVNSLRGARDVLVAIGKNADPRARAAGEYLASALGLKEYTIREYNAGEAVDVGGKSVLWIGPPLSTGRLPQSVRLGPSEFMLNNETYDQPGDTFFGMFHHPVDTGHVVGVLLPNSYTGFETVCRKVPHYGKYSYLAFRKGQNTAKGTWPIEESPLVVQWDDN